MRVRVGVCMGVGMGVCVTVDVMTVMGLWEGKVQVSLHLQLVLDHLLHVTVQAALYGGVEVHKVLHMHGASRTTPRHTAATSARPAPRVAAPRATAV